MTKAKVSCPVCGGAKFSTRQEITIERTTAVDFATGKGQSSYGRSVGAGPSRPWICDGCGRPASEGEHVDINVHIIDVDIAEVFA